MELNPYIYHTVIDPFLKSLRYRVYRRIEKSATVLDIACGTGDLALMMAEKCNQVTGIDLYEPMIRFASVKAARTNSKNTEFLVADAARLKFTSDRFDIATMSLALHQFGPDERKQILAEALRVAPRLIIADYAFPIGSGFLRTGVKVAERIAGREHFMNFSSYNREGGAIPIAERQGYRISDPEISGSGVFSVLTIERNGSFQ